MKSTAKQIISLLDLSVIGKDQSIEKVEKMIANTQTPFGQIAGICVLPAFVSLANKLRDEQDISNLDIIAHLNSEKTSLAELITATEQALNEGADQIELMLPYQLIVNRDLETINQLISTISGITHQANKAFIVILECGELETEENIKIALQIAIENHADFLKTSNGTDANSTTADILNFICNEINSKYRHTKVGLKLSGGIPTIEEANKLLEIVESAFGKEWVNPNHLRFCSSTLFSNAINALGCMKEE